MNQWEFGSQDVSTAARGLDWRMMGAALAVPGIYSMFDAPFHLEFWVLSVAAFLLTVLLIGQGIFAFGTGDGMRKWRWRNRIVFGCDLACLFLFATNLLRSLHQCGSDMEWIVIWCLLVAGMLLRVSFYCSLARKIRAGWVASLIYGISLIPLFGSFMVFASTFNPCGNPAWLRIPERIWLVSACVAILSALCMTIQLRVKLFRLACAESQISVRRCLIQIPARVLIIALIFILYLAYGMFCFHERDRIYEANNRALMATVKPLSEAPKPAQR